RHNIRDNRISTRYGVLSTEYRLLNHRLTTFRPIPHSLVLRTLTFLRHLNSVIRHFSVLPPSPLRLPPSPGHLRQLLPPLPRPAVAENPRLEQLLVDPLDLPVDVPVAMLGLGERLPAAMPRGDGSDYHPLSSHRSLRRCNLARLRRLVPLRKFLHARDRLHARVNRLHQLRPPRLELLLPDAMT